MPEAMSIRKAQGGWQRHPWHGAPDVFFVIANDEHDAAALAWYSRIFGIRSSQVTRDLRDIPLLDGFMVFKVTAGTKFVPGRDRDRPGHPMTGPATEIELLRTGRPNRRRQP